MIKVFLFKLVLGLIVITLAELILVTNLQFNDPHEFTTFLRAAIKYIYTRSIN